MTEPSSNPKRVLLVDDDPIVLSIYRDGLSRYGFQIQTAGDGIEATKSLRAARPDVMVLDLMMPKLGGLEVLRYVRSQPALADLPVVVVSNSYMDGAAQKAALAGAQKALVKVRCTPALLRDVIREVLGGEPATIDASVLLAASTTEPAPLPTPHPAPAAPATASATPAPAAATPRAQPAAASEAHFKAKARRDFLEGAAATCTELRSLFQVFSNARSSADREVRLQNFYRKVHFLTATAGLAECHLLAQTADVFEALLFDLMAKPAHITPSVLRTMALTVDFLDLLFKHARETAPAIPPSARALVVDDDPLSNRLVVAALRHAHFDARSTEDPFVALMWLQREHYDVVLLDIEMPKADGFEVCKRIRAMPGYKSTPVIYVTSHSDFESRAKSVLSGGDDLITKPVLLMELAVKAVTLLLCRQVIEPKT